MSTRNAWSNVPLIQNNRISLVQETLAGTNKIKKTRWWTKIVKNISIPFHHDVNSKSSTAVAGDVIDATEDVEGKAAASMEISSTAVTKNCRQRVQQLSVAPSWDETICLIQKDSSTIEKTHTKGRWWRKVKNLVSQPLHRSEAGDEPVECTRTFSNKKFKNEEADEEISPRSKIDISMYTEYLARLKWESCQSAYSNQEVDGPDKTFGPVGGRESLAGVQHESSCVSRIPTLTREHAEVDELKPRTSTFSDYESTLNELRARLDDPVIRHISPMPGNSQDNRLDQEYTLRVGWNTNMISFPDHDEPYNPSFCNNGVLLF